MRNVSDNSCRENQITYYIQNLFPKIVPYEIMRKNIVDPDGPQMAV